MVRSGRLRLTNDAPRHSCRPSVDVLFGALTLAQDEASSTVYGMPREAAKLNAAERVLRPSAMARILGQLPAAAGVAPKRT